MTKKKPSAGKSPGGTPKTPKPTGRPSSFTQEVADQICERLAKPESLRSICSELAMPTKTTVFRWLEKNESFRDQYARAREHQADAFVDELPDIADDGHNDFMLRNHGEDEVWVQNGEALQRSRLRVDARKWMAGKLAPKKYGEKLQTEVSGVIEVDESPSEARRKAALALLLARQG